MQRPSIKPGPRWFCKQRRQVHCSAMRPRQSRWLIQPEIYLLLSGWTVFGRQARIRNREGTNGRAARTTDGGHRGQHQPGSNGVRHRQHRGAARRRADTRSGRSRGRCWHSWLEQRTRTWTSPTARRQRWVPCRRPPGSIERVTDRVAYGRRRYWNPAYPEAWTRLGHRRTRRRRTSAQPAVFHFLAATSPLA